LACSVFRAVEFRKPHLIAANTGISAWVDSKGRVRCEAPRRTLEVLFADVTLNDQETLYLILGDWLGIFCLGFATLVAGVGLTRTLPRLTKPSTPVCDSPAFVGLP